VLCGREALLITSVEKSVALSMPCEEISNPWKSCPVCERRYNGKLDHFQDHPCVYEAMATNWTFERLAFSENRASDQAEALAEIKRGERYFSRKGKLLTIHVTLKCSLASRISAVVKFKPNNSLRGILQSPERRLYAILPHQTE
jgi:hypothetical protein